MIKGYFLNIPYLDAKWECKFFNGGERTLKINNFI